MPLIAHANQTKTPSLRPAAPPNVVRARRAVASALAVLAVAGPVAGCAAASSGSSAAAAGAGAGSSSPVAAASASAAGTGAASTATPTAGSAASSPGFTGSAPTAPSCAGHGTTGASAGSGEGGAGGEVPALAAVQFVDSGHGWVAGAGRIMATADGGADWSSQYAGPADLDQVDFIDDQHGWAAGGGTLLRTVNGGASWTALAEPCAGDLNSVHFVSPSLGYAVAAKAPNQAGQQTGGQLGGPYTTADGGTLLRTTDGGATWTTVSGAPANPQSACFANADDGYLGTPARIWRTTDGGQHWTLALTEPHASAGDQNTDTPQIECAGPSGLWVLFLGQGAAMEHAPYLAYASQDGRDWHGVLEETYIESAVRPGLKLPEGPGSYPGPFSAIDPGDAAFVGYSPPVGYGAAPVMIATDNGYDLASDGDVAAINQPFAASFLSQQTGWVVGENLQTSAFDIEATSDGGRSWTTQYTTG
jgi:photosystem II stability/assembly factor-like uncharacterized protein